MNLKPEIIKKALIGVIAMIFALLVILLILIYSEEDSSKPKAQQEEIVLEYWGLAEPESVMLPIINKYEDQNPNIKIKYTQRRFHDYENTLYTRLEQGMRGEGIAPDIVKINNTWLPKFQQYLTPLPNDVLTAEEYTQKFYPTANNDFLGDDNQLYAIPIGIDGLAVFYNKELLLKTGADTPPKDWDSFIELAKKLTIKDNNGRFRQAGLAMGVTNNVSHSADIISLLLLQNNVKIITQGDQIGINLTSRNARDAINFYTSFSKTHEVWSSDLHLDLDMFFRGELAMFFAPSWRAFDIIEAAPHIEFGISPAPQLETNLSVNYAMYRGAAVSSTSQNPKEAWKFLKFLVEEENIKLFHEESKKIRAFGQPYPLTNMQEKLRGDKYLDAIAEMAPSMKAWPLSQNTAVERVINSAIDDPKKAEEELETIITNILNKK